MAGRRTPRSPLRKAVLAISLAALLLFCCWSAYALFYYPGVLRFRGQSQQVVFRNGDVTLAATLHAPVVASRRAIVFVHGSGPGPVSSRPEIPYRILANAFLRRNTAVLLFDKRGSGKSGGNLDYSDYSDLAGDVSSAVGYLRSAGFTSIGLFGRSEGGWVAPLAAQSDTSVDYLIINAGGPVPPFQETVYSMREALRTAGFDASVQSRASALALRLWHYYEKASIDSVGTGNERESLRTALATAKSQGWLDKAQALPAGMPPYDSRAMRAFAAKMFYDPIATLRKVRQPVLAVFGANDESNPTAESVDVMSKLIGAGKRNFEVRVFPGVGHAMTTWKAPLNGFYVSGFLQLIGNWASTQP